MGDSTHPFSDRQILISSRHLVGARLIEVSAYSQSPQRRRNRIWLSPAKSRPSVVSATLDSSKELSLRHQHFDHPPITSPFRLESRHRVLVFLTFDHENCAKRTFLCRVLGLIVEPDEECEGRHEVGSWSARWIGGGRISVSGAYASTASDIEMPIKNGLKSGRTPSGVKSSLEIPWGVLQWHEATEFIRPSVLHGSALVNRVGSLDRKRQASSPI
jgi:hypothetical protein